MTDAVPLKLFNSLTRHLENFQPVHPGEARVYTCGPTVYNYPHIGNMRAYVFADVLGRTLSFKGYKLTHVINITDVGHLTDDADSGEDKLEKAAAENAQNGITTSIWDIARHYTQAYWDDVKALNIRQPAQWSIATDYVPAMIEFAKGIADQHCYELPTGLYFDTSTVANYGRLARANTDEGANELGGRIDPVDGKRHAADFAIWRKTPAGETRQMEWDSPWGKGAPGWHLECSVMSGQLLGFPFDIHTGGIDHREIHHPNEIAQNQAFCHSDASGANIWMHNNFLIERSGKMSKSSGEFLRLQLLIDKGYHPLAYRLMCLQAHYRSELEFSWEGLQAALVRLKRLVMAVDRFLPRQGHSASLSASASSEAGDLAIGLLDRSISTDLNTPQLLAVFEDVLSKSDIMATDRSRLVEAFDSVLGLNLMELHRSDLRVRPKGAKYTASQIDMALIQRLTAREEHNFTLSDHIRDDLKSNGVEVRDGDPLGWDWKLGA